jgi:hypothetical protein
LGSMPATGKDFHLIPDPDRLWSQPILQWNAYHEVLPWRQRSRGVKLTLPSVYCRRWGITYLRLPHMLRRGINLISNTPTLQLGLWSVATQNITCLAN